MVAMQTIAWEKKKGLATDDATHKAWRNGGWIYLNGQIEKVEVPKIARNNVLIDNGHADGSETIRNNRQGPVVVEMGQAWAGVDGVGSPGRGSSQEGALLFAKCILRHADNVVLVLLVRHFANRM